MQLPGIAPLCGVNVGGLLGCLRVFPVANVLAVPRVVEMVHQGELQLYDAQNYADLWFTPDAGSFEEPDELDELQGTLYKPQLRIVVPQDAPDVAAAIRRYRELRYFLALYQDGNGHTKLVGSLDWPLRFAGALSTGQKGGDPNGYTLLFAASTDQPAAFYSTFAAEPPSTGRKVFTPGFTFGFVRTP